MREPILRKFFTHQHDDRFDQMKVSDLPALITAAKADWLAGTTWLGFSPTSLTLEAHNRCQGTILRQYANGYVIEYITEQFSKPNPGFENDPIYLAERKAHAEQAGRFIAVHKLKTTSLSLDKILGSADFKRLQDMWSKEGKRWRWSVAFPIVESYDIVGRPKAKEVLGDVGYRRLFQRSSATLRTLNSDDQAKLSELELTKRLTKNAQIGIEMDFLAAERSTIDSHIQRAINHDLAGLEGESVERLVKIKTRAAWISQDFIRRREREGSLSCDDCGFKPTKIAAEIDAKPRAFFDVHHTCPLDEGIRHTTVADFALLCPTCHRIEHVRLRKNGM